jgi:DNA-binding NtrC family response regulator
VMAFRVPALRDRVQDIAPLARGMAARFSRKFGKALFDLSIQALAALERFSWPGNIRQLENVMQQAVLVSSGPVLLLSHLPASVQQAAGRGRPADPSTSLRHNRQETERLMIQQALATCGNSRTLAAQSLGISRVTLYKKMKKYGIMERKTGAAAIA